MPDDYSGIFNPKGVYMAVQIVKSKLGVTQKEKTVLQQKVDRLGEVDELLKGVKDLLKERDDLRKYLAGECAEADPATEVVLHGQEYEALFSAASKTSEIQDIEGYFETVGQDIFVKTIKVSITEAKKYLTPAQQEKLIKVTPGSRTLKAVIKSA